MEGACFALLVLAWWAGMGQESAGVPRTFKVVAAGFVFWSLLQVVPLPPSVLGWVSPGTHRLYVENLPGYASPEGSADLQSWLLQRRDTPSTDLTPRSKNRTGFEGKLTIPARWKPISWYPDRTLQWLSRFLAYGALFLLVVKFLPERACRKRLPRLLLLLGFGIAVLGILQHLTWNGKIYWFIKVYQGHPFGPWVNSNHFSGYLEMILPLGGAVLLQAGDWAGSEAAAPSAGTWCRRFSWRCSPCSGLSRPSVRPAPAAASSRSCSPSSSTSWPRSRRGNGRTGIPAWLLSWPYSLSCWPRPALRPMCFGPVFTKRPPSRRDWSLRSRAAWWRGRVWRR